MTTIIKNYVNNQVAQFKAIETEDKNFAWEIKGVTGGLISVFEIIDSSLDKDANVKKIAEFIKNETEKESQNKSIEYMSFLKGYRLGLLMVLEFVEEL